MTLHQLPGRPVHIKIAADHVNVIFEKVPWPFRVDDVHGAIDAFSSGDWAYLQELWWGEHRHLQQPSSRLAQLVPHLDADALYSPDRLISLGCFLGLFGPWDLEDMERDLQRLSLIPELYRWPREGFGVIVEGVESPQPGWPGRLWRGALEEMVIEGARPGVVKAASRRATLVHMPQEQTRLGLEASSF